MTLRLPVESDRAEFVRSMGLSEEHMRKWIPRRPEGETLDGWFDRTLERAQREWRDGIGVRFIGFLHDGPMAGTFSLNNVVRGCFQNADAGWLVMADCIRRGIATEGVSGLLDFALSPAPAGMGLHRVQANIMPHNAASLRVAQKCGFRQEGIAKAMLMMDGAWQDHVMFAKLSDEHVAGGNAQGVA
jgi:ribosomal-protein-alanine N-acetyltransferase